jgi:peptide/nickel transport system ATP-binding protein
VPRDPAPGYLLEGRSLTKEYVRGSFLSRTQVVRAVDAVDFRVEKSSVTAILGASGSGKSTFSRCLVGLERPTWGQVLYHGADISRMHRAEMIAYRRKVQVVLQDAAVAINPRFTAALAISEPLKIAGIGDRADRKHDAIYWMEQVGLPADAADRPALEFSGGERQRLVIARALSLNPEVIIFDEAFSALDLPVQARILDLLTKLRASYNLTYVFISHDLTLLARICSEAAVMYHGRIVEMTSMGRLLSAPVHFHSKDLVGAIPCLPPDWLT